MSFSDSNRLAIRGLQYHVHLAGPADGPVVFLLHGLLDTGASFAPMLTYLSGHRRYIAPDWRGHGDTDNAPQGYWFPDYLADLDALIEHYAADAPVALVAHSMGGTVASLYAGLRPKKISHLICLDALFVPARQAQEVPRRYASWLDAQRTAPTPKTYPDIDTLAERIRKRYPELDDAQVRYLAENWSQPNPNGGIQLANDPMHIVPSPYGFNPEHAMQVWRQVSAPVLCLDGADSPGRKMTDDTEMDRRRSAFAQLTHARLPGAGHMLHLEQPAAVAEHIAGFLGSRL